MAGCHLCTAHIPCVVTVKAGNGGCMFQLTDFLMYCFVTAYTPGANNLLSMSDADSSWLPPQSVRFNLGILSGFFIIMTICTVCSATLGFISSQGKTCHADIGGALHAVPCMEGVEKPDKSGGRRWKRSWLSFWYGTPVCQPEDLYLCNYCNDFIHTPDLSFYWGSGWIYGWCWQ